MRRLTDRALDCLTDVWSGMVNVKFSLAEVESNPHLVQIVAPNEVVIVIGFEIKMGNRAGSMSLCIPFNVVEPVMHRLASEDWFNYRKKNAQEDQRSRLQENMAEAKMKLRAYLGQTTIKVQDLLSLDVGDVLKIDKEANEDLILNYPRIKYPKGYLQELMYCPQL